MKFGLVVLVIMAAVIAVIGMLMLAAVIIIDPVNKVILGEELSFWDMVKIVIGIYIIVRTLKSEIKIRI